MKSGWVKQFADRTEETGWDADICQRKSSWSRGQLSNIRAVDIFVNGHKATLASFGMGQWWQSDRYDAAMGKPGETILPQLKHRQVQYKVHNQDIGKIVYVFKEDSAIAYRMSIPLPKHVEPEVFCEISPEHEGKWLTLRMKPNGNVEVKFMGRRC